MFFTRTHHYNFSIPKELLGYKLIGNHIKIHDLDFQVLEDDHLLTVLPHTEETAEERSFPITELQLEDEGNNTKVVITSRIRKVDSGLPLLLFILCILLLATSFIFLYIGNELEVSVTMCAFTLVILLLLFVRLQKDYFGYVRKIHGHIKYTGDQITKDVRRQLFKHKAA